MINEMLHVVHVLTHPFIQRQLVYELVEGGGINFGLGCVKCGEIEWIDYYRGMEIRKGQEAIHTTEWHEYHNEGLE